MEVIIEFIIFGIGAFFRWIFMKNKTYREVLNDNSWLKNLIVGIIAISLLVALIRGLWK